MIHSEDTAVADAAVVSPGRLEAFTFIAEFVQLPF